jgi:hypothetical protein
MSDHKGAALIYPMLPDAETLLPTRAMIVMHSERLSPDAASRLAFHREPSAGCPQRTARPCIDSATRSRTCSQSQKTGRPLRLHILQRYLHRRNRYLLARSMSPDPLGYKNHVSVDRKHKIIRRYSETDASVHDSQKLDEILDKSNTGNEVWANIAYRSAETEAKLRSARSIVKSA